MSGKYRMRTNRLMPPGIDRVSPSMTARKPVLVIVLLSAIAGTLYSAAGYAMVGSLTASAVAAWIYLVLTIAGAAVATATLVALWRTRGR